MSEEQVSEAAGVNSAAGSFGLSFGLAFAGAIMLATISIMATVLAHDSSVLSDADSDRVAAAVEHDAEVMSDTQLAEILAGEPPEVQAEVIRINAEARDRALQVALLVPILAGAVGFVGALRMRRLPDPDPSSSAGDLALG
jgi:hypothetical protein